MYVCGLNEDKLQSSTAVQACDFVVDCLLHAVISMQTVTVCCLNFRWIYSTMIWIARCYTQNFPSLLHVYMSFQMGWLCVFQAARKCTTHFNKFQLRCLSHTASKAPETAHCNQASHNLVSINNIIPSNHQQLLWTGPEEGRHRWHDKTPWSTWLETILPLSALAATTVLLGKAFLKRSQADCAAVTALDAAEENVLEEAAETKDEDALAVSSRQEKLKLAIEKARDICQRIKVLDYPSSHGWWVPGNTSQFGRVHSGALNTLESPVETVSLKLWFMCNC